MPDQFCLKIVSRVLQIMSNDRICRLCSFLLTDACSGCVHGVQKSRRQQVCSWFKDTLTRGPLESECNKYFTDYPEPVLQSTNRAPFILEFPNNSGRSSEPVSCIPQMCISIIHQCDLYPTWYSYDRLRNCFVAGIWTTTHFQGPLTYPRCWHWVYWKRDMARIQ